MATRPPASVTDAALRILGRRDHTRLEMDRRLAAKGYGEEEVTAALVRLAEWGYLDDRRVAAQAVEECLSRRPRGRELLRAELLARGVPEETAEEALRSYPPSAEERLARAVLVRLRIRMPLRGRQEQARAWRALARLGFAPSTAERICGLPET